MFIADPVIPLQICTALKKWYITDVEDGNLIEHCTTQAPSSPLWLDNSTVIMYSAYTKHLRRITFGMDLSYFELISKYCNFFLTFLSMVI